MKVRRIAVALFMTIVGIGVAHGTSYASNGATQHFGPYASTQQDRGTCGNNWATDTYNLEYSVRNNMDGTFTVTADYKDGSFVTNGGSSYAACISTAGQHGMLVAPGITGHLTAWITGSVSGGTYNPSGCSTAGADCSNVDGFIAAVFGPDSRFTCDYGFAGCSFNFEYSSSDQSLIYHHVQDGSSPGGPERIVGDIATS